MTVARAASGAIANSISFWMPVVLSISCTKRTARWRNSTFTGELSGK